MMGRGDEDNDGVQGPNDALCVRLVWARYVCFFIYVSANFYSF